MLKLAGDQVFLRALESSDIDFLYQVENDMAIWELSGTLAPYSKELLRQYIDSAHLDIYEAKQLRLCICENGTGTALGFVDLFDFEPCHKRVGVGIIIYRVDFQNKGIGSEALRLVEDYCFQILDLHQIYANVLEENQKSNYVFTKLGYQKVGIKKDWIYFNKEFKNEILYQKIRA